MPNDPRPATIVAVDCDALFGHYTYRLRPTSDEGAARLLLLYGDNGSGKTTIAQLLFHLLSPEEGRGHRTFLARTKFRRFAVHLDNGLTLAAKRPSDHPDGPFTLTVSDGPQEIQSVDVKTSDDGAVKTGDVDDEELRALLSLCSPTTLDIYLLSDNRVLESDVFEDEPSEAWTERLGRVVTRRLGDSIEHMLVPSRTRDLTVGSSVWRAESWLRRQAIQASSAGEVTTSNIYTDIIKRITQTPTHAANGTAGTFDNVVNSLVDLAERSKAFSVLGLSQPVPIDILRGLLESAGPTQQELLAGVLEPYVDSIRSRLDAFAELQRRLSSFLNIINAFYRRKAVQITTTDGIQVFDDDGAQLDPSLLSSGEKQLMLLLSNILVATTRPSVFIIDEPELSLNVKWQRQLVESLLSLVDGSHVQFVMATHSIELLTRHQDCVLKLDDVDRPGDSAS